MYGLLDYKNRPIEGRAYGAEVQEVKVDEEKDLFEIEILKRQKKKGKWMVLVHWVGYGSAFDTWMPESHVTDLKKGTRNKGIQ